MNSSSQLWYKSPARRWTEALPIGNGNLGAMVFGKLDEEILDLNLDTLWSGRPYENQSIPDSKQTHDQAQALSMKGEYKKAEQLLEEKLLYERNGQTYLPLGKIRMQFDNLHLMKDYRRELDLECGIHSVKARFTGKNGLFLVEYKAFVSYPDNCLMLHIKSEEKIGLKLSLDSQLTHAVYAKDGMLFMNGQCPGMMNSDRDGFLDENGMFFAAVMGAKSDGNIKGIGGRILIDNAKEIMVILSAEDSFNGFQNDPLTNGKDYKNPPAERVQKALKKDYAQLYTAHTEDYASLFSRMELNIGETEAGAFPTDQRLINHDAGAWDPSLYTLLFNYARYLIISASRPGTQCMNLQGIWNEHLLAPWCSNYTVNINTEMNYWPVLAANLCECDEPLISMLKELSVTGKEAAKQLYDAPGWICHHNSDLWRQAFPAKGLAQWGFWYNGGAWLSRHLFDHYLYTMDEAFLKETAYPIIRGCAEFYMDMLVENGDGTLILAPSTSPENRYILPDGRDTGVSRTTAMTMSIARETLENTVSAAKILHEEDEFTSACEKALSKLYPLKIGKDGRLMEWYDEMPDFEVRHRHVSHLYALHPAHEITPEKTPELADACKKTLEVRGDDGTGWSLGWKINFWARLEDGNHALRLLDRQLRFVSDEGYNYQNGGGTYLNLFDAHPPFQIDGNFGAASGILEMLLKPVPGEIHLLPALPEKWARGYVRGLKAPGNVEIDMKWKNGKVTYAKLSTGFGGDYVLNANGMKKKVRLEVGRPVEITF
ncbi:MAG: glycoside hydrolase family 95 protein [Clostridia bacterium]|nr:glycoside hydrolase family 95 protein [Clostridia bacterium]